MGLQERLAAQGKERLPDLAGGGGPRMRTSHSTPMDLSSGSSVRQARAQVEQLATASARTHANCASIRNVAGELGAALAQAAAALCEWQRAANAQAGAEPSSGSGAGTPRERGSSERPSRPPPPWALAVRSAQDLSAHLAALQAEAADVMHRIVAVAGAHGELQNEVRRWMQTLPREAYSADAAATLFEASAVPPPLCGKAGPPLLRELRDRYPNATMRVDVKLGSPSLDEALPDVTLTPMRTRGGAWREVGAGGGGGAALARGSQLPRGEEKMTWACTASRLSGPSRLAQKQRGGVLSTTQRGITSTNGCRGSQRNLWATATNASTFGTEASMYSFGSASPLLQSMTADDCIQMRVEEMAQQLTAAQSALSETKAELHVLRTRNRDRAPPVVLRLGGAPPPVPPSGEVFGSPRKPPGALVCTRMELPKGAETVDIRASEEDAAELRRLKYQLEEVERDLARAHRFLKNGREELREKTKVNEELHETVRKVRVLLQEAMAVGLTGFDEQELVRELKKRSVILAKLCSEEELVQELKRLRFDFSKLCPLLHRSPSLPDSANTLAVPKAEAAVVADTKPTNTLSLAGLGATVGARTVKAIMHSVVKVELLRIPKVATLPTESLVPSARSGRSESFFMTSSGSPDAVNCPAVGGCSTPVERRAVSKGAPGSARGSRRLSTANISLANVPPRRTVDSKRIKELWRLVRAFSRRLALIGGEKAHVEVALEDLYNKVCHDFMGDEERHTEYHKDKMKSLKKRQHKGARVDFDGQVGIYEFIGRHARETEFDLQVWEIMRESSQGAASVASSTNLLLLEQEMAAGYNAAYERALKTVRVGVDLRFAEANGWFQELFKQRGTMNASVRPGYVVLGELRQDAGYQLMGLDRLYETVRRSSSKMEREIQRIARETTGHCDCVPLKGRPRARSKVLQKYGMNASHLTDVMRCSIVYPGIDELYAALVHIIRRECEDARHDMLIMEVNDRFQHPKDGYRDISMLIEVDGVLGELQLHIQQIKEAKHGKGHDAYKQQRSINESLFEACVRGNVADIVKLAEGYHCCSAMIQDKNGRTALHYGCQVGSIRAVRKLLKYRADPWAADSQGLLPVEVALRMGCGGLRRKRRAAPQCKLCKAPAVRPYDCCGGRTCSKGAVGKKVAVDGFEVAETEHGDVVRYMLASMRQAEPEDVKVVRNGPVRLVSHVIPWWVDYVVHMAGDNGGWRQHPEFESWLYVGKTLVQLAQRYQAQERLKDWMLQAAATGQAQRVQVLLEADFDERPAPGQPWLLDRAIENGHRALVSLLRDSGKTYASQWNKCKVHKHLAYAARAENAAYATAALEAKAEPDTWDAWMPERRTPLMAFAAAGDLNMCKVLVEYRAQVDWTDNFGCGAVHYARALRHKHVETFLDGLKQVIELPQTPPEHSIEYLAQAAQKGCAGAVWRFQRSNLHLLDMNGGTITSNEDTIAQLVSQKIGTNEDTPLHRAMFGCVDVDQGTGLQRFYRSDFQVARSLLLVRANPMAVTKKRDTPLHLAALTGVPNIYDALLTELKAYTDDPAMLKEMEETMVNEDDQVPRDIFARQCHASITMFRGLHDDDSNEKITLLRVGFLAFDFNRIESRREDFELRLGRMREAKAQTWFELIRRGNLPTKEEIDRCAEQCSQQTNGNLDAALATAQAPGKRLVVTLTGSPPVRLRKVGNSLVLASRLNATSPDLGTTSP